MTNDARVGPTAEDIRGGSDAYATYGATVGWKSHDGRPMPPWFDLGPVVQGGWIAVGRAQRDAVSRETLREPDLVACLLDEWDPGDGYSVPGSIDGARLEEIVNGLKEVYRNGA